MPTESHDEAPPCVPGHRNPLESAGAKQSIGFMLSRVGASVSEQFAERISVHGLVPRQFLLLNLISEHEGESQQAVAESIGVAKSHMVGVVDELEVKKLVERRINPEDRRQRSLHLTNAGQALLSEARKSAHAHENRIRALLTKAEAETLLTCLHKLTEIDDVPAGMHPGFAKKFE